MVQLPLPILGSAATVLGKLHWLYAERHHGRQTVSNSDKAIGLREWIWGFDPPLDSAGSPMHIFFHYRNRKDCLRLPKNTKSTYDFDDKIRQFSSNQTRLGM